MTAYLQFHSSSMSHIENVTVVTRAQCVQVRAKGVRQHSGILASLTSEPDATLTLPVHTWPDLIIQTCAMRLRASWRSRMPSHDRMLLPERSASLLGTCDHSCPRFVHAQQRTISLVNLRRYDRCWSNCSATSCPSVHSRAHAPAAAVIQ
jgi:hypothetical protein